MSWSSTEARVVELPRPRSVRNAADTFVCGLRDRHGQAVLAFATGLTRDRLLAEDVAQETMIRAWRNMDRLDLDRNSMRSWLYRVAQNIVIDKHRARRLRPMEVDEAAGETASYADSSDHIVTSTVVHQALSMLPHRYAVVLREYYLNGLNTTEVAAVLGIPRGTVKSRLYRAMGYMREQLAD